MNSSLDKNCIVCGNLFQRTHWRAGSQVHCSLACRFWEKVDKKDVHECWNWKASLNSNGYGQINIDRKPVTASRVAYELAFGHIEDGKFVLHKCDNPKCVNPHHLFLGSHADNMSDMAKKGRAGSNFMSQEQRDIRSERFKITLSAMTKEQKLARVENQKKSMMPNKEAAAQKTRDMWANPEWRSRVLETRKTSKSYSESHKKFGRIKER